MNYSQQNEYDLYHGVNLTNRRGRAAGGGANRELIDFSNIDLNETGSRADTDRTVRNS
jgi:hypothetical protein